MWYRMLHKSYTFCIPSVDRESRWKERDLKLVISIYCRKYVNNWRYVEAPRVSVHAVRRFYEIISSFFCIVKMLKKFLPYQYMYISKI